MQSPLSQDRYGDLCNFFQVEHYITLVALQLTQPFTSEKTTDSDGGSDQNIIYDHSLLPNPQ